MLKQEDGAKWRFEEKPSRSRAQRFSEMRPATNLGTAETNNDGVLFGSKELMSKSIKFAGLMALIIANSSAVAQTRSEQPDQVQQRCIKQVEAKFDTIEDVKIREQVKSEALKSCFDEEWAAVGKALRN